MNEKLKPNFTQIPNWILDDVMHDLEPCELKVLMYIMRRTYGFQKNSDRIAISQIMNGIKSGDNVLDRGTGLGKMSVVKAIKQLQGRGLIKTIKTAGKTTSIKMCTSIDTELVQKVDYTSTKSGLELVQKVDTQKKEKESIQKKDSNEALQIPVIINFFKEINPAYKNWFGNKTQRRACKDLLEITTMENLEKLITKIIPISNGRKYAPTITTPHQLLEKYTQLQSYWEKEKHNTKQRNII